MGASKGLSTHYRVECHDKDGNMKWVEEFDNLVVTAGLNDSLDKHFKGSTYTAAWYVGITAATPSFAAALQTIGYQRDCARLIRHILGWVDDR